VISEAMRGRGGGGGAGLEREEKKKDKNESSGTYLPAICVCALVLGLLRGDTFVVADRICSSVLLNIEVLGREPLSMFAGRDRHGGRLKRMTFTKGGKWAQEGCLPTNPM